MDRSDERGPFYAYDLHIQIASLIDSYQDHRDEYWKQRLGEEEWSRTLEMQKAADAIAEQVMSAAMDLAAPSVAEVQHTFSQVEQEYRDREREYWQNFLKQTVGKASPETVRELTDLWDIDEIDEGLHSDSVLRLIWERLCIDLARDAVDEKLLKGAKRLLQLVKLAVSSVPSEKTSVFLKHVGRCFAWGFDAECVILCRGAIDTAFWDAVSDELCATRRQNHHMRFGLQDRIEAALPTLIDKQTYDAAIRVKLQGDKAVHDDPDALKDVLSIIRDTLKVISKLST